MPVDVQIEQKPLQIRSNTSQMNSLASTMSNNCSIANNNDARHLQLINDQEPPDGDETDPDVIPNQYGKFWLPLAFVRTQKGNKEKKKTNNEKIVFENSGDQINLN